MIQGAHGLYDYLQSVQGYLAPPIFVVFFFGVFWKRLNAAGLPLGHGGRVRHRHFPHGWSTPPVTMRLAGFENGYPPGSFLWMVNNINFQYFSVLITIVSALVMVVCSYATAAPDYARIGGLTFDTASPADRARTRDSWEARDVVFSAIILPASWEHIFTLRADRPGFSDDHTCTQRRSGILPLFQRGGTPRLHQQADAAPARIFCAARPLPSGA